MELLFQASRTSPILHEAAVSVQADLFRLTQERDELVLQNERLGNDLVAAEAALADANREKAAYAETLMALWAILAPGKAYDDLAGLSLLDFAREAADAIQRAADYADTLRAMLDALTQSYDFYQRLARAALDRHTAPAPTEGDDA